jgi:plastocyanin
MRMRHFARLIALTAACTSLAACGGGGGSDAPTTPTQPTTPLVPASPNDVLVQNNNFNPTTVTVAANSTVKWTWATCSGGAGDPYGGQAGQTCVDHQVNFDDGSISPAQDEGTYSRTFTTPGTYNYHCAIHGAAMAGKVVVQ